MVLKRSQFTVAESGALVAEASSLGIAPGVSMPQMILVDGEKFYYSHADRIPGETLGWWFEGLTDQKVLIAND
jgi:hypothetical protein